MNRSDRDFYVAFVSAFALSLALTFAIFGLLRHSPSSFTSRSISESLADDANKELVGPAKAVHTKRDAIIVPEIELRKVAMQMFFCTVLISADAFTP